MPRFRRRHSSGDEGIGWIYADLFLAMTIVGLGSSIVTVSNPSPGAAAPTTAPKTFQLSCREFPVRVPGNIGSADGSQRVEKAINDEIADRGWNAEVAKPGLVLVMGGFSGAETPGQGDGRAKSLLPRLREASPLLEKVEMRTGGARSVRVDGKNVNVGGAGSYLMIVYLLFSGPPLDEDCTN